MHTPQVRTLSTSLAVGIVAPEKKLRAQTTNTIVLPKGTLVKKNKVNMPTVKTLKRIWMNMVALLQEMLYVMQDGITAKLGTREICVLHVLSDQKSNMEQLSLQCDEVFRRMGRWYKY